MTPTFTVPKPLDTDAIAYLAGRSGPCVTIFLPPARPGSAEGSHRAFLKTVLKDFPALLESLDDLTNVDAGGNPGLAIFSASQVLVRYEAPFVQTERVVTGSYFHITPLLSAAVVPREFFVLDVNKKQLRLLHIFEGECRPVALPPGVPENMEEAGTFAKHSKNISSHKTTGPGQSVHFGKEGERNAGGEYLHHFFAAVDEGIAPVLAGKPLVLAGVHEELAAYRRFATYPAILNSEIHGNTAFLSLDQVESHAKMAVMADHHAAGEKVLQEIGEMKDRSRQATGLREVCGAAAQGRVHQLCIADGAEFPGILPEPLSGQKEDMVNAAAVLTIRAGGTVFVVPPDRMEYTGPVAAILRY